MSQALEGTPKPTVTLTEQTNGQRIPRSMFIGHTVGYLIVFGAIAFGAEFFWFQLAGGRGFEVPLFDFHADFTTVPPTVHLDLLSGNIIVKGILLAASTLVWCDLIVRRRHDRNRAGLDGILWLLLFVASQVLFWLKIMPEFVRWLDLVVCAGALYLFVVLVILPGNPHENRYGAVPRPD